MERRRRGGGLIATRCLDLTTPTGRSRIIVGRGLLSQLGQHLRELLPVERVALLSDETVASLHAERARAALGSAGIESCLFTFPAGESSKSIAGWGRLVEEMLDADYGRDSAVVALGGGVTGDLGGFVAATYLRGVPYVGVPTSLLSMLDSSVGGKTGINTRQGKNLVGAFHQPALVLIDIDLLETLPPEHYRAGLAEAVKTAAILDGGFFRWCEEAAAEIGSADPSAVLHLVETSVAWKVDVVQEDPREAGRRQVLNFGHTAGHALEALASYRLAHGTAVAMGMRIETRLGERLGITEAGTAARVDALLDRLGLRAAPPSDVTVMDLQAATRTDKKRRKGATRWVLLAEVGAVARDASGAWSHAIDASVSGPALEVALRELSEVPDSPA